MDIWDWLKGLRTWWWLIVVFPLSAAAAGWMTAPEPKYETQWTVNILFDNPWQANNASYVDFIFLDDLHLLIQTHVLGDIIYLRLPEDVQANLTRHEFGTMVDSARKAHFVEITVSGDDPELVSIVATTIDANLEDVADHYLLPPTYPDGFTNVNVLDPIPDPTLNSQPRLIHVGAITLATLLVSLATTGVAEWLRLSYRAKNSAK